VFDAGTLWTTECHVDLSVTSDHQLYLSYNLSGGMGVICLSPWELRLSE